MRSAQVMFGVFFGVLGMMVLPLVSNLSGWRIETNIDSSISWAIVCAAISICAAFGIFIAQQNQLNRSKRLSGLAKIKLIAFQLNSIKSSVDKIIGVESLDDWHYMQELLGEEENLSVNDVKEMVGNNIFAFSRLDRASSYSIIELPSDELSSLMSNRAAESFEFVIFAYLRYSDYIRYIAHIKDVLEDFILSLGYSKLHLTTGFTISDEENSEIYKRVDEAADLLAPALGSVIRGIYENYELFDAMMGVIEDEDGIVLGIRDAMVRSIVKVADD